MNAGSPPARKLTQRSTSALAFLIVAVFAAAQSALLATSIASQRDGAHTIDISGAQRMRSQRIAFLAIDAYAGTAAPGWQRELQATIDETRATQGVLVSRKVTRVGSLRADGTTPLMRLANSYLDAAERIVHDHSDAAAISVIRRMRIPLFTAYDAAVHVRAERFERQREMLHGAVAAALVALLAAIFSAWWFIVVPAERRTGKAMRDLIDSRRQFRSLFQENPEAIAVYDLTGHVERGNRAATTLLGQSAERLHGAHFTEHVAPEAVAAAWAGFERAAAGGTQTFDTVFVGDDGERIDVAANLFPSVVSGKVAGVFGVARDMRELRRVQRSYREQAERIAALYAVASGRGMSSPQQIAAALHVAATHLRADGAFLSEVAGDAVTIRATAGPGVVFPAEFRAPLGTVPRADGREVATLALGALTREFWPDDPALRQAFEACAFGVAVRAGDSLFGSLTLVVPTPQETLLSPADVDFFGLVSALVGSAVERGRQEGRLDTLAFFDTLTNLPNRALLYARLGALLTAVERTQQPFAVHYVDLDRFKQINDNFGHAVGDSVLRIAAMRMSDVLRSSDTVARIGGDEFVVLQPAAVNRASAKDVADRLLEAIACPFVVDGVSHQLGASIGISLYPEDGRDIETLLRRADDALYRAKHEGRNRLQFVA